MMPITRRDFPKAIAAAAMIPAIATADAPLARFFRGLSRDQRGRLNFPFDHPLRTVVRSNWAVVKPTIGDLSGTQQALCLEILRGMCSEDGFERFRRVMGDDSGGFARYHVAIFGESPGEKPCEWVLTGRHVTIRCNLQGEVAGPIFYGHASTVAWSPPARTAGTIFDALDDAQKIQGVILDSGQSRSPRKAMIEELSRQLGSPFRRLSVAGDDPLRLLFFGRDAWKLEGPGFSWHYHGHPHGHCWLETDEPPAR